MTKPIWLKDLLAPKSFSMIAWFCPNYLNITFMYAINIVRSLEVQHSTWLYLLLLGTLCEMRSTRTCFLTNYIYMVTAIVSIDWRYLHTNCENRLLRKCDVFCSEAWRGLELAAISPPMCKRAFSQLYWGSMTIILRLSIHEGISTASNFHHSLCHHVPIQLAASYSFKITV